MAALPPHPHPSPFRRVDVGEGEGHSAEVRDLISDNWLCGPVSDARAGRAAASAGTLPLPAGLARGTLGAAGMTDAPRGGAVLRRIRLTRRRASLTSRLP